MIPRITAPLLLSLLLLPPPLPAQPDAPNNPDDAERLFVIARDLWAPAELQALNYSRIKLDPNTAEARLRQACLFLQAAVEQDPTCDKAWHDLMILYSTDAISDPGRATQALVKYSDLRPDDQHLIDIWLKYRLNLLKDRQTREFFLQENLPAFQDYPYIASQVLTQLGVMALEKGIINNTQPAEGKPMQIGARQRFITAFSAALNNDDALARLLALPMPDPAQESPELTPEQLQNQAQFFKTQREIYTALLWRVRLRKNPYDFPALLNLIDTLDRFGRHQLAQKYYEYAYTLIDLVPHLQSFLPELRFKQLVSAYSGKLYNNCIDIAQQALPNHPDDLLILGLQAKAMEKLGMQQEARDLLRHAAETAQEKLAAAPQPDPKLQDELAWFFCFIDPDPVLALQYAQAAYQAPSKPPRAAEILAYAQVLNEQYQPAQELLAQTNSDDPIAALAWAMIHLAQKDEPAARKKLESIDTAPSGILTEKIQQLLGDLPQKSTQDQAPPQESAPKPENAPPQPVPAEKPDLLINTLNAEFTDNDLLIISTPQKVLRCSLWLSKDIYQYAEPILAQLYLSNISDSQNIDTKVVLGPDTWIDPHVLITAEVQPSPPSSEPLLLTHRYLIQKIVLLPGKSNTISESLSVGPLRRLLDNHPQQTYRITFRAILDPVPNGNGSFQGKIPALQPSPVTITRKAFIPTSERLNSYFNSLATGLPAERIRVVQLMAGLLREAQLARQERLNYNITSIDEPTMRELIGRNLNHPDSRVRAWSAYALHSLPLSAESSQGQQLTELLNDSNWFVRFLALNTLDPVADMTEYFNWVNILEKNIIIQRQVQLFQHLPWPVVEVPVEAPEPSTASTPTGI